MPRVEKVSVDYKPYYPQYATRQGRYTTSVEFSFLERETRNYRRGATFADISGGGGRVSIKMAELGFNVVHTEIDLDALRHSRRVRGDLPVRQVQVEPGAQGICFGRDTLDGALCFQVPDLIENDVEFFPQMRRVLKPGAPLFLSVTNRSSYKNFARRVLRRDVVSTKGRTFAQTSVYRLSFGNLIDRAQSQHFHLVNACGFNWLPFAKGSNSRLIGVASKFEAILGLRRLPAFSPWVILHLRSDVRD